MKLLINIILFIIAVVLVIVVFPVSMVYTLIRGIYKQTPKYWYDNTVQYFFDIAYSIDQLGNVLLARLLNDTLISHPFHHYIFGNPDETISSVIGRNNRINNLTWLGKGLRIFLDTIESQHCELAAQYYLKSINYNPNKIHPYGKNN